MPRRGIAVAVIVIVACFIVLGLTSDFLVDWAWFSAIGYLDVSGRFSAARREWCGLPSSATKLRRK
jgi:hypothetical protein